MDHPTELGHVHLKVRDADRAVEFYRDALGLDVTERVGDYAFLAWSSEALGAGASAGTASEERHHDVALQGVGPDAAGPGPGVGLYHAAFEVGSADGLRETYRRLRERGVEVAPVDHGISKALYFDDPDGNGLEVYLDTREANDREAWRGRNERFDPESLGE